MDVRVADEIAQVARAIADHVGDRGLDVLVNNAGYGLFAPLEVVPMERFRDQLDVNVSGQLAVTQAVLPHVRAARGRIVVIGSIADRITMPFAVALTTDVSLQSLGASFRTHVALLRECGASDRDSRDVVRFTGEMSVARAVAAMAELDRVEGAREIVA